MYARLLFGLSAILFGIVALMSQSGGVFHRFAIPEIVGGIGMLHPKTARAGAIVLGVIYAIFSLAAIPGIVAAPSSYVQYGNLFEQVSVVCGASAASSRRLAIVARLGIGLCSASFGIAQVVYFKFTASLVPAWIPPGQSFWTVLTTLAFFLAAIAMLVNIRARLAARLLTVMLALFGVLVWIPHVVARPSALGNWSEFAETLLIAGAAWLVSVSLKTKTRPFGRVS